MTAVRRVGVEEELFLVDPESGNLRPVSNRALHEHLAHRHDDHRTPDHPDSVPADPADPAGHSGAEGGEGEPQIQQELFLEQLETATVPCRTLADLDADLRRGRRTAAADAERAGAALAAVGTAAVLADPAMTQKSRYQRMAERHGLTTRDNLICGTHVHVEVADDEEAVAALDRIRQWLPALLAVSANSPFWHGEDSGYAGYRAQVVNRWPTAGPNEPFGNAANYHAAVADLIRSTAALDRGMIYFDARLSVKYSTLEIRVADVCTEVDDAVLIAALARGLVDTAVREAADGTDVPQWRIELLRAANWNASRWGMGRDLVHPVRRDLRPAFDVLGDLIDHVQPSLDATGDTDTVRSLLDKLHNRGTGSVRQRAVFARRSRGEDVMLDAVERTRATYA
jgi:glutamate---cysteine ligase / carboxylate-amine ligase